MVQYGRSSRSCWTESVRSSFGRTIMGKAIWENPSEVRLGQSSKLGMSLCTSWKRVILICACGWHQIGWKETILIRCGKVLNKEVDLGEPTSFLDHVYLGMYSKAMWNKQRYCGQLQNHVRIANFSGENWKTTVLGKYSYFFMVLWHGRSCQEMCGTFLWVGKQDDSTTLQSIYSMHRWPSFQRGRIEICGIIVKSILSNCPEMLVLGTNWETWYSLVSEPNLHDRLQNDKRLSRLISYIHLTYKYKQYCYVGNTAKQFRLGLFQDSDFAGDLEDSKSASGGTLCVFGSHTFEPISWMCKKQTSVSHSSTESDIISLDAGLRLGGLPALELWDLIVSVFGTWLRLHRERSDLLSLTEVKKSQGKINVLSNIDCVPSNFQSSHQEALLYVFEDNEAVIKMIIKRRSPTMRHVSRTHRVALDWLFDRINLDPKIQFKYIDTKNQLADILTKGNFTRDLWYHLLCLFNISHFSSTTCLEVMSKRTQQDAGEESVTAISKPMMNVVSRCSERTLWCATFWCIRKPGKARYESQIPLSSRSEQHHRAGRLVVDAYSSSYSE